MNYLNQIFNRIIPRSVFLFVIMLGGSCSKHGEVSQITVMVGSKVYNYDSITIMEKLSGEKSIGIWGSDYGGQITLLADGKKVGEIDAGGHVNLFSSETKAISLKGEVSVDLYVCVVLQVFEKWPEVHEGVLLEKRKIPAGVIDYSLELEDLVNEGFKVLAK